MAILEVQEQQARTSVSKAARLARLAVQEAAEKALEGSSKIVGITSSRGGVVGKSPQATIDIWKTEQLSDIRRAETDAYQDIGDAYGDITSLEYTYEGLTPEEQRLIEEYGPEEVEARRRLAAQAGFERDVQEWSADKVEISPDVWVDQSEWNKLTSSQQREMRETGSYTTAEAAASQAEMDEFDRTHTNIGGDKWVLSSEWDKLTPSQKQEVRDTGSYTVTTEQVGTSPGVTIEAGGYVVEGSSPGVTITPSNDYVSYSVPTFKAPTGPFGSLSGLGALAPRLYDLSMEVLTFGQYQNDANLVREYEAEKASAASEGMILVHPDTGAELTKSSYIELRKADQSSMGQAAKEWLPFSQMGKVGEYGKEGPWGWTKFAGLTALDLAMVVPVVGWAAKGASVALKLGSVGSRIAALGGEGAIRSLAEQAIKGVAATEVEISTKQAAVRTIERNLAEAITRRAPAVDIANWQKALNIAKVDLNQAIIHHGPRLAAAKAEVVELTTLLGVAEKGAVPTIMGGKLYSGAVGTMGVAAKVTPIAFRTFGALNLATVIHEWPTSGPFAKGIGLGMSALAFGLPGKVVGGLKTQYELARFPGRIPSKVIQVPPTYLPGSAGMPKTSVRGLSTTEQMEAMRASSAAMEDLWRGVGRTEVTWPGAKGLTYAPRAEFQRIVPKSMISATPTGEVFQKGVYEVLALREPAQFFAPWGFPQFTEASAVGLKGSKPTYMVLFSDQIGQFPKAIWKAPTPEAMRLRAEAWYRKGAPPEPYPGYKLFHLTKEPEFTVPMGTFIGEAEGGLKLWTRARAFGPRIKIDPYYVVGEEGARRVGFTWEEALKLKSRGPMAEWKALRERVSLSRGLARETSMVPSIRKSLGGLRDARRSLVRELEELGGKEGPKRGVVEAQEVRIGMVEDDISRFEARLKVEQARTTRITAERLRTGVGGREVGRPFTSGRAWTPSTFRRELASEVERVDIFRPEAVRPGRVGVGTRGVFDSRISEFGRLEGIRPDSRVSADRISPEEFSRDLIARLPEVPREAVRVPGRDTRMPRIDARAPGIDLRGPRDDVRGPRDFVRVPGGDIRGPRDDVRGPRDFTRIPKDEIKSPKIFPFLGGGEESGTPRPILAPGTITWRQGFIRKYLEPPYTDAKPISVYEDTGSGVPKDTIKIIGGPAPLTAQVDLGVVDVFVEGNTQKIRFTAGGLKTDVGKRLPSKTRGMSVTRSASFKRVRV